MRKKITLVASLAFAMALCAGVASANVSAQADTDWTQFTISEASIRTATPAGLRFKVNCPVDYSEDETVEAWTKLTFVSDVDPDAPGKTYTTNVPATAWRTDGSGWNAVLLDIPASDYVTEVTAQSFVKINETTVYQTNEATTSIAKTAATSLSLGIDTSEAVANYVKAVAQSVTVAETATLPVSK